MGMFSEVASNACANKAIDFVRHEFDDSNDPRVREVLVRLAEKMLELNEWTTPADQRGKVDRMRRDLRRIPPRPVRL